MNIMHTYIFKLNIIRVSIYLLQDGYFDLSWSTLYGIRLSQTEGIAPKVRTRAIAWVVCAANLLTVELTTVEDSYKAVGVTGTRTDVSSNDHVSLQFIANLQLSDYGGTEKKFGWL